ncbi:unnamed protein product [Durusdinium trenchii]|uniref:Uncharacterized protein n=2 Tax=Durusdinium trenchii TaxID=1381693 RepID=A0ABP0LQY7_9DINO
MARSEKLWMWAARSAKISLEDHMKTAAFVDAVGRSASVLKALSPMLVTFARLSAWLRGMDLPPGDGPQIVRNWNTSEEFLEGAEQVYRHALVTAFTASELEVTATNQFRQWVKEQGALRQQDFPDSKFEFAELLVRFENLTGPRSLEALQKFAESPRFQSSDREQLKGELQQDLEQSSKLNLQVLALAEVRHPPHEKMERRLDRVLLQSSFNLAEGISSDFEIAELENLTRYIAEHFEE